MDRKSILLSMAAVAALVGFGVSGCEKHSWEETQKLHQGHHGGEEHADGAHHEAGAKEGESHDGAGAKHEESGANKGHEGTKAEEAHAPKGEPRDLGVK